MDSEPRIYPSPPLKPIEPRDPSEGTNSTNGAIALSYGTRKKMLPEIKEPAVIATSAKKIASKT